MNSSNFENNQGLIFVLCQCSRVLNLIILKVSNRHCPTQIIIKEVITLNDIWTELVEMFHLLSQKIIFLDSVIIKFKNTALTTKFN